MRANHVGHMFSIKRQVRGVPSSLRRPRFASCEAAEALVGSAGTLFAGCVVVHMIVRVPVTFLWQKAAKKWGKYWTFMAYNVASQLLDLDVDWSHSPSRRVVLPLTAPVE